jgi:hypothetical protein
VFFSTAMTAASPSIHGRLASPTTNMISMSVQQHPTHEAP